MASLERRLEVVGIMSCSGLVARFFWHHALKSVTTFFRGAPASFTMISASSLMSSAKSNQRHWHGDPVERLRPSGEHARPKKSALSSTGLTTTLREVTFPTFCNAAAQRQNCKHCSSDALHSVNASHSVAMKETRLSANKLDLNGLAGRRCKRLSGSTFASKKGIRSSILGCSLKAPATPPVTFRAQTLAELILKLPLWRIALSREPAKMSSTLPDRGLNAHEDAPSTLPDRADRGLTAHEDAPSRWLLEHQLFERVLACDSYP